MSRANKDNDNNQDLDDLNKGKKTGYCFSNPRKAT